MGLFGMSLSSICAEQHDKEADALNKFVAFSLVGSVGLHLAILALSQLFPASPVQTKDSAVIELIVTAPPEPEVIEETPESPELPAPADAPPEAVTATAVVTEVAEPTRVESQFRVEADTLQTRDSNESSVDVSDALRSVGQPRPGSQGSGGDALGRGAGRPSGGGSRQAANSGRRGPRTVGCAYCPKPNYPESALADGVEGSPNVSIDTDANGNVIGVSLIRSSGNGALDQAVLQAVRGWRLETGGIAVSNVPIEVEMNIRGSRRHRESQRRGERREMQIQDSAAGGASGPAEAPPPAAAETRQSPAPTNVEADANNLQPVETGENPESADNQETVPASENAAPNPAAADESAPAPGAVVPVDPTAETVPASEAAPTIPSLSPEPEPVAPQTPSPTPEPEPAVPPATPSPSSVSE